jgi:hypothetical protein
MGFFQLIGSMIKRAFLYQFLIFFAVFRLLEAFRFHKDFQTKLFELFESLHLNKKILNHLPKDTEILYKVFLITLIVLSSFSILGIKFFQFITGLFCILNGFIYHNPIQHFKDFNKTFELSFEFLNDFLPSFQFLIFFGLGCAMIKNSFYYNDKNIYDDKISNKQIEMEKMNNKIKKE